MKCIRGDTADNIQSALPGVRATAVKEAYDDEYKRTAMMKQTWGDQNKKVYLVEDLFNENELLIHLDKQPEPIIKKIDSTIAVSLEKEKHFSMFHILKFLGKYELNKIKDNIDQYIPLLSRPIKKP